MPRSILVVDDERAIAFALSAALDEEGYAARSAFHGGVFDADDVTWPSWMV